MKTIRDQLIEYLSKRHPRIDPARDLLSSLDSLAIVELVNFLRTECNVPLDLSEFDLENFRSLESLIASLPAGSISLAQEWQSDRKEVIPLSPPHASAFASLWAEYSNELALVDRTLPTSSGNTQILLYVNPEPIGFAVLNGRLKKRFLRRKEEGFISHFFVCKPNRRKRIATTLHEVAESYFKSRKFATIALVVLSENRRARRFWEALGYQGKGNELQRPL